MVTVKIDEETLVQMLTDRVSYWTTDPEIVKLFEAYYQDCVDNGMFEGAELDVMVIVDNDYVNYTHVVSKEDFDQYGIKDDDDLYDRMLANVGDLYLISA